MRALQNLTPSLRVLVALLLLSACSDDPAQPSAPTDPDDTSDGTAENQPAAPEREPFYVLGVEVSTPDGSRGFLTSVPALEPGGVWNLDDATELGTGADIWGNGDSRIFVGSGSDPLITRWDVQADGSFRRGPSVSFANLGLTRTTEFKYGLFLNELSYFEGCCADGPSPIVVWDYQAMEVVGKVEWTLPDGFDKEWITFSGNEERVIMTVSLRARGVEPETTNFAGARIYEIDPRTHTVIRETDEPRCKSLSGYPPSLTPGAPVYLSTPIYNVVQRELLGGENGVPGCALRLPPGAAAFDPDYELDLNALTGGRPAGELLMHPDGKTGFFSVWHSEFAPELASDRSNWQDVADSSSYQWWRWSVGSDEAELIPDQPPRNLYTNAQPVLDGKQYVQSFSDDFESSYLRELTPSGEAPVVLEGSGTLQNVIRVH